MGMSCEPCARPGPGESPGACGRGRRCMRPPHFGATHLQELRSFLAVAAHACCDAIVPRCAPTTGARQYVVDVISALAAVPVAVTDLFNTVKYARTSPPLRTKWTRRVPHPVLIGRAASLTPCGPVVERPCFELYYAHQQPWRLGEGAHWHLPLSRNMMVFRLSGGCLGRTCTQKRGGLRAPLCSYT